MLQLPYRSSQCIQYFYYIAIILNWLYCLGNNKISWRHQHDVTNISPGNYNNNMSPGQELLDQVPLVCKRWRKMSHDRTVWTTLDLYHHHEIRECQLRRMVRLHPHPTRLILRYRHDLTDRTFIWCFFHLKQLRSLDLSHCRQVYTV